MSEPLDELYFRWLYAQVGPVRLKNPSRTYWSLLKLLHTKEFVWIIPNDDNRLEDGRDLRDEFVYEIRHMDVEPEWMSLGCSMLEMLIGLARRLWFEDDRFQIDEWFWHLMENLGLSNFSDRGGWDEQDVDDILSAVIWRIYEPDGSGGLFPLKDAQEDQREVELWYQMSEYLLENGG
jgi:hypothetical protein